MNEITIKTSFETGFVPAADVPDEIGIQIFSYLNFPDLARCQLVNRKWQRLAIDRHIPQNKVLDQLAAIRKKFGEKFALIDPYAWIKCFGYIKKVPPLPKNIIEILDDECPFWENLKVYQTHMLILLPKTVKGKNLTLNYLAELVKNNELGKKTKVRYRARGLRRKFGKIPFEESSWALITKSEIHECSSKKYLRKQASREPGYREPTLLEAAVSDLILFASSGKCLFKYKACTYTLCRERFGEWGLAVGRFSRARLDADKNSFTFLEIIRTGDYDSDVGVIAILKL